MKAFTLITSFLILSSLAATSYAHKRWVLPSQMTLSTTEDHVAVDITASNDLFYVDKPFPFKTFQAFSPDNKPAELINPSTGKKRSTFDLAITQEGTYKITTKPVPGFFASYEMPDVKEPKRIRGPSLAFIQKKLPKEATNLKAMMVFSRVESFITNGSPTQTVLVPSNSGLEWLPITHPNDIAVGEPADFQFLMDGKPAKALTVTFTPEGTRYRNAQSETVATTNDDGKFSVTLPHAGRYLVEAEIEESNDDGTPVKKKMYSYFATIEVLDI